METEPCTHPALPAMKLAGVTRPFYCYICVESVDPREVRSDAPTHTMEYPIPHTWLDLARGVAQEFDIDLSPAAAEVILWEYTGFPGFWEGDPIECCTRQLREYFAASPPLGHVPPIS